MDLHSPYQLSLSHVADSHNYIDTISLLHSYEVCFSHRISNIIAYISCTT